MNIIDHLVRHKGEQYVIKAVVKKVSRSGLIHYGSGNTIVIKGCGTDMVFEILYRLFGRLGVKVPDFGIYSYQLL